MSNSDCVTLDDHVTIEDIEKIANGAEVSLSNASWGRIHKASDAIDELISENRLIRYSPDGC